jgi:ATP-binding cassette subfamily B protein
MWGGGGGFGAGNSSSQNAASGLPFAGIPTELAAKADKILRKEPEHKEEPIEFSQVHDIGDTHQSFNLRSFLWPHKWWLFLCLLFVGVGTILDQLGPLLTSLGIDHGIVPKDVGVLLEISAVYLGVVITDMVISRWQVRYSGWLGEMLMYELRVRVFSHFQRLSMNFFTDEMAGRLMTRMTSDIDALSALFPDGMLQLGVQGLTLVVISVILFFMSPPLAIIMIVIVMPVMLAMTLWFRRASDRGYLVVRDRIAGVLADLQESLSGIRIITANNRRRHNIVNHDNVVGSYMDSNVYTARIASIYGPGSEAIGVFGQALILLIGGKMVLDGNLTIGQLTAFVLYLTAFFAPIQQLVQLYNTYQQGQAAVKKLRDLLDTVPEVPEKPDAEVLPPIAGAITLRDVTFGYRTDKPVITNVDLQIQPGETFALVGPTGAGKSTIAKLVSRFYDPTEGAVLIDGHDIRDVTLKSLRSQLGVVPQEPFLFHGSIRDNVSFGRPDATEDEIMEACRAVGVDDLVERSPQGLDTPCHERGASLSSGERQLLALARAFLARPRVLILDEATSNLDLRSEAQIEQGLDALLEGRTGIVIAHRLATAMRADRIAVVDRPTLPDGTRSPTACIVELGSHDELVALGGQYADMYATWIRHTEAADTPA